MNKLHNKLSSRKEALDCINDFQDTCDGDCTCFQELKIMSNKGGFDAHGDRVSLPDNLIIEIAECFDVYIQSRAVAGSPPIMHHDWSEYGAGVKDYFSDKGRTMSKQAYFFKDLLVYCYIIRKRQQGLSDAQIKDELPESDRL